MLLSSKNVLTCAVITLCLTIYAYTAPTNYHAQPKLATIEKTASDSQAVIFTDETSCVCQSISEAAATDFSLTKPSVYLPDTIVTSAPKPRTLPAVPGAVFMTLMGVCCILFFRERRTLVTVFAGIFLLSHFGIKSLPKLTARLIPGKHGTSLPAGEKSLAFHNRQSNHPAGRSDSIEFIGLLHRLAGSPDADGSFTYEPGGLKFSEYIGRNLTAPQKENVRTHPFSTSIALITQSAFPRPSLRDYLKRSITFTAFSPAFIFENLSRGPPLRY